METQPKAYGETFRRGISRALERLDQVGFLSEDVKETLTSNAAKLCLAEAIAEQKAVELSERARKEWDAQAPQIIASIERLVSALKTPPPSPTATAEAADSPQTPPEADGKPEA
ncbi:MAG: hypothetical protein IT381_23355 [Deltaproteobacteria bacterium]|nr:hypothetical protein [Deltaproteobacteria bacterium]